MLKISKSSSVVLSLVISGIFTLFLLLVGGIAWNYAEILFPNDNIGSHISVIIFTYGELIFAFIADFVLIRLLLNIKKNKIFDPENVDHIRVISWMCFTEAILFFGEGIIYGTMIAEAINKSFIMTVFFVVAFACGFMGLIVRVVKNMMEAATALKDENDYTI